MSEAINKQMPEQSEQAQTSSPADRATEKFREDFRTSAQPLPGKLDDTGKERPAHPDLPQITIGENTGKARPPRPDLPPITTGDHLKPGSDFPTDKSDLSNLLRSMPYERSIIGGIPYNIEGKFKTNTGDALEIKDGKQTLTTADGKTFVVDKDGSISGDAVTSIKASKDGKEREVTLSDGTSIKLDRSGIARIEHPLCATEKVGSYTLSTGDKVTNSGDKQVLTTPSGTKLTVNKDGSYEVDGKIVSASADGKTIKLGDGSEVRLENGKIAGLERNGENARVCGDIPTDQWDRMNRAPAQRLPEDWKKQLPPYIPDDSQQPKPRIITEL